MYFPPYKQLFRPAPGKSNGKKADDRVTISVGLFNFLLQVALASSDFDEEGYLDANPEVREHIARTGSITPHEHFVGYGYFEGRKGCLPKVNEQWYLATYTDVAAAVVKGKIASAKEHFELIGALEGRAPSKEYLDIANQWKQIYKAQ